MWDYGSFDWVILGSGYLLALALFSRLGGFARAAQVFRRWGKSNSAGGTHGRPTTR
jgi:hypothetical protein